MEQKTIDITNLPVDEKSAVASYCRRFNYPIKDWSLIATIERAIKLRDNFDFESLVNFVGGETVEVPEDYQGELYHLKTIDLTTLLWDGIYWDNDQDPRSRVMMVRELDRAYKKLGKHERNSLLSARPDPTFTEFILKYGLETDTLGIRDYRVLARMCELYDGIDGLVNLQRTAVLSGYLVDVINVHSVKSISLDDFTLNVKDYPERYIVGCGIIKSAGISIKEFPISEDDLSDESLILLLGIYKSAIPNLSQECIKRATEATRKVAEEGSFSFYLTRSLYPQECEAIVNAYERARVSKNAFDILGKWMLEHGTALYSSMAFNFAGNERMYQFVTNNFNTFPEDPTID